MNKPWRYFDHGGNWTSLGIPWWERSLLCNDNVYKASEAHNLCWPPTLASKHSNPTFSRSNIFFRKLRLLHLWLIMLLHLWLLHLWATKLLQLWLIPKTGNPNSKLPFHDLTVKLAEVRFSLYEKDQ